MKKIIGLNTELKRIGGEPFTKTTTKPTEGVCAECAQLKMLMPTTTPLKVGDVIMDYINSYGFPSKATVEDMKNIGKIMAVGEKLYQGADELLLENAEYELLKEVMNPPQHPKVAMVVVQVMNVIDAAKEIEVKPVEKKETKPEEKKGSTPPPTKP